MEDSGSRGKIVRFGVFEADLSTGELFKSGRKVRVQELPMHVLAVLVAHQGKVVTRDELRESLWPSDTYVDFDRSLNTAVAKLRDALGDSAESPRFIETLPRRGYRFLAPVEEIPAEPVEEPARTSPRSSIRRRLAVLLGLSLAALGVILKLLDRPLVEPLRAVPLTSYRGDERHPHFSPDGSQVVFSWNGENEDNYDIYVKTIGPEMPTRLTDHPAADTSPVWSPDGTQIAFVRTHSRHATEVIAVPPVGGPERVIAKGTVRSQDRMLAWHPSGAWLAFVDGVTVGPAKDVVRQHRAVFLISAELGERRQLTFPPSRLVLGDQRPVFSPDGRKLAFVRGPGGRSAELHTQSLNEDLTTAGSPVQITNSNQFIGGLQWTANGKEVVFSLGSPSLNTLYRMKANGGEEPRHILGVGDNVFGPNLSAQGNRLVFSRGTTNRNIVRLDLKGDSDKPRYCELIASTRGDNLADYSPDGKKIVFMSHRSGSLNIWVCDADGSNAMSLTHYNLMPRALNPSWSPGGRHIVFTLFSDGVGNNWVMDADGGNKRQVTDNPLNDTDPVWSPDGQWIYFRSNRSGTNQVWKKRSDGTGDATQITQGGGGPVKPGPTGRFLYYGRRDSAGTSIWRVPVQGGPEEHVVPANHISHLEVASGKLYYISRPDEDDRRFLCRLNLANGNIDQVAELDLNPGWGLSISPDERYALYSNRQVSGDLMLVENFR